MFNYLVNFTKSIVDTLAPSPRGVHVGYIVYGSQPKLVFNFNAIGAVISGKNIKVAGSPRIDLALKMANEKLFTPSAGARNGAPKVKKRLKDKSR
jgi:hypothetical protein